MAEDSIALLEQAGTYFPSFLDARKMSKKALVAVVQEAFVEGASTRKVDDLVQPLSPTATSCRVFLKWR